jgi:hypothetical protein
MTHPKNSTQKTTQLSTCKTLHEEPITEQKEKQSQPSRKGESLSLSGTMADDQGSSKPWHSNTSKLDEGSLNGLPVCPAPAEETIAVGKSEIRR